MLTTHCPTCNAADLTVPRKYIGKNWRCPKCRVPFAPQWDSVVGANDDALAVSGDGRSKAA